MNSLHSMLSIRRFLILCGLAGSAIVIANAQSSSSNSSGSNLFMAGKSSSNEFHLDFGAGSDSGAAAATYSSSALPAEPAASHSDMGGAGGAAQDPSTGRRHKMYQGFALELGAGFNAPIGNDTSSVGSGPFNGPFITWGGNLTAGGGLRFSQRFSLLGEFQFIDDKLPGAFIAYDGGQTGNTHIVSITADPMIDLFPKRTTGAYITGGGGYYHKSTNFNVFGGYDYYGNPVFLTADSFSSNQLGGNLGLGITRKLGGVYGDGKMKLFAEARYLFINTPPITASSGNGLGTTELIPVTLGVRF